jgi:drug/metabolite transporter (DMT)-like permease
MPAEKHRRLEIIVAFLLVYVFWGSTYLAIGIADQEHLPPLVMCAMRFLIAGPLMLLGLAIFGRSIRINREEATRLAVIGCLLLVGGNGGLAWAEQFVPTGFAALIVAITPIWFLLIEVLAFRGDRLSRRGLLGMALGIAGVALLFWTKFEQRETLGIMQILGATSLLFSSFSWAVGSVLSRKWQMKTDPLAATAWEMIFAGLAHVILSVVTGQMHRAHVTPRALTATLYLVVFGSWIGYSAYIWLLKHVPTPKVATYAYINPIVAVFLGWLVLHERFDVYMLAGTAIIVAGVALVTTARVQSGEAARKLSPLPDAESGD